MNSLESSILSFNKPIPVLTPLHNGSRVKVHSQFFSEENEEDIREDFLGENMLLTRDEHLYANKSERLDRIEKKLRDLSSELKRQSSSSTARGVHSSLKTHVQQLGESTALACRHLTTGLSEVQEATVNMYDWAEKMQTHIEALADCIHHETSRSENNSQDISTGGRGDGKDVSFSIPNKALARCPKIAYSKLSVRGETVIDYI